MNYYCNIPVNILADLGDEVLIEVLVGKITTNPDNNYEENSWTEPVHSRLIVLKKYITDSKIDFDADFKMQSKALAQSKVLMEKECRAKLLETQAKIDNMEKELSEKIAKFDGLNQVASLLNGDFQYVVTDTYYGGIEIYKFNELVYKKGDSYYNEKTKLRAVIASTLLVTKGEEKIDYKFTLSLSQYSDGSSRHENTAIVGFKTLEEAVNYAKTEIIKKIKNKRLEELDCKTAEKYNMNIEEVFTYRKEQKKLEEDRKASELEALKIQIAKLQS